MGFDADTDKCGVVLANLEKGVIKHFLVDYNTLINKKMPDFLNIINKNSLFIKIEIPTLQTAIGVNKSKLDFNKYEGLFHSGRCAEIAFKFRDYCLETGLSFTTVKSQHRIRCDRDNIKQLTPKRIISKAKKEAKGKRFLSKLDYYRAKEVFPELEYLNEEIIDAALLILPEWMQAKQAIAA